MSRRIKTLTTIVLLIASFLFLNLQESAAAPSAYIKNVMKVLRMGSYIITINYRTFDRQTDNVFLRVDCEFDRGRFTFASSSMRKLKCGSHKTKLSISQDIRKKYGSLQRYHISLYKNGILLDAKESY